MGARLQRKDFSEKVAGCWSAEEAAAEGIAAACMLVVGWEASRGGACIGYADGWVGGAGRLAGAWGSCVRGVTVTLSAEVVVSLTVGDLGEGWEAVGRELVGGVSAKCRRLGGRWGVRWRCCTCGEC